MDLDIIADLDSTTGLPVVDHQSSAQRWHDALSHGSEQNLRPKPLYHEQMSARSALNKPRNHAEPTSAMKTPNSK